MPTLPTLRRRTEVFSPLWRDWDALEGRMARLMEGLPFRGSDSVVLAPRVDFAEEDGKYVLTAELPGVDPKDVEVEVEGNVLSIKGEKKVETEREEERVRVQERRYGAFERVLTLPQGTDPEQVSATFNQGVLRVEIRKRAETQGRKIKVQPK